MQQGDFVWYELCTPDPAGAAAFYAQVVGWKATQSSVPGADYTLLCLGERPIAGLMSLPPEQMPPRPVWCGYVAADDVDAKAAAVVAAEGAVHKPPQDIPNIGRFAVVADPQGAVSMLFNVQGEPLPPLPMMQAGTVGWHELHASDWEKAWPFYAQMFGWTKDAAHDIGPFGTYQLFRTSGLPCGGMMTDPQAAQPYWLFYFVVEDIDAGVERVTAHGGTLLFGPREVPGGAWVVNAQDPQGGVFALVGMRTKQ